MAPICSHVGKILSQTSFFSFFPCFQRMGAPTLWRVMYTPKTRQKTISCRILAGRSEKNTTPSFSYTYSKWIFCGWKNGSLSLKKCLLLGFKQTQWLNVIHQPPGLHAEKPFSPPGFPTDRIHACGKDVNMKSVTFGFRVWNGSMWGTTNVDVRKKCFFQGFFGDLKWDLLRLNETRDLPSGYLT
jgi:hypothetical protein